jgi:hypothetical protein
VVGFKRGKSLVAKKARPSSEVCLKFSVLRFGFATLKIISLKPICLGQGLKKHRKFSPSLPSFFAHVVKPRNRPAAHIVAAANFPQAPPRHDRGA